VLPEALALSVGGGLVGICAGAGGAMAVGAIFPALPVDVSWWSIWLAFGFAMCVGIFSESIRSPKPRGSIRLLLCVMNSPSWPRTLDGAKPRRS